MDGLLTDITSSELSVDTPDVFGYPTMPDVPVYTSQAQNTLDIPTSLDSVANIVSAMNGHSFYTGNAIHTYAGSPQNYSSNMPSAGSQVMPATGVIAPNGGFGQALAHLPLKAILFYGIMIALVFAAFKVLKRI